MDHIKTSLDLNNGNQSQVKKDTGEPSALQINDRTHLHTIQAKYLPPVPGLNPVDKGGRSSISEAELCIMY